MVSSGVEWCQLVSNGVKWCQMVSTGIKWCQPVSTGVSWCQLVGLWAAWLIHLFDSLGLLKEVLIFWKKKKHLTPLDSDLTPVDTFFFFDFRPLDKLRQENTR